MRRSDLVCSKEQGEKLSALGVSNITLFYYHPEWNNPRTDSELYDFYGQNIEFKNLSTPVYTVAELGLMLPEFIKVEGELSYEEGFLECYKDNSNSEGKEWFLVRYLIHDGVGGKEVFKGFNIKYEAQARAEMLIFLLENKIIKVKDVNKALRN